VSRSTQDEGRVATAFAPATVANVCVGFDVLGFAVEGVGDRATVTRTDEDGVVGVDSITGVVTDLPTDSRRNTASVAIHALLEGRKPGRGFRVALHKGIPLGSGMGGSAASAVAAVVAANQLLDEPLPKSELLRFAAAGEQAASGAPHADNAAPCLYGGLTAVVSTDPLRVVPIPVPEALQCVVVHPHMTIETRQARAVLRDEIRLVEHTRQSMRLCGFVVGCFSGNFDLIAGSMDDLIVEPQRSRLIPGFAEAKAAAREAGAVGFGIAGSGPSVFAWVNSPQCGSAVESAVREAFDRQGLKTDSWAAPIHREGAACVTS